MAILNDDALTALMELIYGKIGPSGMFMPYDNILYFLRTTRLIVPKADADSLGLPVWEGLAPSLISKKPDERQTKEWLTRYLRDLNSRSTLGHFLPAALETVVQGVLTYLTRGEHQDQNAVDLDRVLDLAGLGVDFTDGAYQLVARQPGEREFEQKFKILYSARQAERDFNKFAAAGLEPTVMFVDIDRFKEFNDRFTEVRVDKTLLPSFQTLLRKIVDTVGFAYRHGGEEFLLLLPHGGRKYAIGFANLVRHQVEQHDFAIESDVVRMTVSIGVAFSGQHSPVYEEVLFAANEAKKLAKDNGRNRVEIAPNNRLQPPALKTLREPRA